jgi:hypothetical protein
MTRKPKTPRIKLNWSSDGLCADYLDHFPVQIIKGEDMNPGYYDLCRMGSARYYWETSWYVFVWSYVPEKGKMLRREVGHGSRASMRKLVEEYLARPEVDELYRKRLEAYLEVKNREAKIQKEIDERRIQEENERKSAAEAKRKEEERLEEERRKEEERQRLISEGLWFPVVDHSPARMMDI